MSFEITYSGDIQYIKVFYSTAKTRECKYHGKFYKKMDAIANDLKRLKKELDEDSEKAAKIAKDAANIALADRFGALRYIIDEQLWDEDMIVGKMLDTKKEEMLALAQKTLNYEVILEEDGAEEYSTHLEGGKIAVNSIDIEMNTSKDGKLFGASYWDWDEAKLEKLETLDWFVIWTQAECGTFRAIVEEGVFDKAKIKMKKNLLHYGDLSIDNTYYGKAQIDSQLEIFFGDDTRKSFKMEWRDQ
tara:strand:+ start:25 stop:759 length:735 start_codon:yes stop_codon:yes gene_type:complete